MLAAGNDYSTARWRNQTLAFTHRPEIVTMPHSVTQTRRVTLSQDSMYTICTDAYTRLCTKLDYTFSHPLKKFLLYFALKELINLGLVYMMDLMG